MSSNKHGSQQYPEHMERLREAPVGEQKSLFEQTQASKPADASVDEHSSREVHESLMAEPEKTAFISITESAYPALGARLFAVWYRHVRVYTRNIFSNGLPPFLEPLIFLVGIGIGLGAYISHMDGFPFIEYLASGLLVTTAMFTAAFECSFGTFIRLEFQKTYDGMLSAPITVNNLLVGEIIWAGTKGFFFTMAVLLVISVFRIIPLGMSLLSPVIGFFTGTMFAALSLLVTSFVKNINHAK